MQLNNIEMQKVLETVSTMAHKKYGQSFLKYGFDLADLDSMAGEAILYGLKKAQTKDDLIKLSIYKMNLLAVSHFPCSSKKRKRTISIEIDNYSKFHPLYTNSNTVIMDNFLLWKSIESLPKRQKFVLEKWMQGYSGKEIGKMLGLTDNPISLALHAAFKSVQNSLKQYGYSIKDKTHIRGIYKIKNRWRAEMEKNGKVYRIGSFKTSKEARFAREEAIKRLGI
jgi:hypothetical protein